MATTDAKTGFRLPWSGDRTETTDPVTEPQTEDAPVQDVASPDQEIETPPMIDALPDAPDHLAAVDAGAAPQPTPGTPPPRPPRPAEPGARPAARPGPGSRAQAEQVHGRPHEGHAGRGRDGA